MAEEEIARKIYNVKGRVFYQKQLVLGQLELLVDLLKDAKFETGLTSLQLLKVLGAKMPLAMAIVLIEEGNKTDKIGDEEAQKQINELTKFFANNVEINLTLKMISDFFVCTPMTDIMQALATLIPATKTPSL